MTLKQVGVALALIFTVTLAVVVAKQMSTEAMAVVIGVVCGVAASIPTSVLLLVVLTHRDRQRAEEVERQALQAGSPYRHGIPPVVVIQGGSPQSLPMGPQGGYWPMSPPGPPVQRRFHVVGGEDLLLDDE